MFCDVNSFQTQLEQKYSTSKIKFIGGTAAITNATFHKIWRDKRNNDDVRVIRTYITVDIDLRGLDGHRLIVIRPVKCASTNLKRAINHITFDKITPKKNNKQFATNYSEINCSGIDQVYQAIDDMFDNVIKDYLEKNEQ